MAVHRYLFFTENDNLKVYLSSEVIKKFHAGEILFEGFKQKYLDELDKNEDASASSILIN